MKVPAALKLHFKFDAFKMKADLDCIKKEEWVDHYRKNNYRDDWGLVPLRSVSGHPANIYSVPSGDQKDFYKNTPILERCLYFQKVINYFKCQVNAARLMKLGPGAKILEHTDHMHSEFRLHIQIQTNSKVEFYINNKLIKMLPGEVWFGDFTLPHKVENNGSNSRVHMVLDCVVNDWLLGLLKK